MNIDYNQIIHKAWEGYDASRTIARIEDLSVYVSTNRVCKVIFTDGDFIIAKASSYGKYEFFKEDHRIIQTLSNNLLYPFENLLAKSLQKNNRVYIYRHKKAKVDVWVVFYNPTRVMERLPRRLDDAHIKSLARQMAKFHLACTRIKNVIPKSGKTLRTDINALLHTVEKNPRTFGSRMHADLIKYHCEQFLKNRLKCNVSTFELIPVFIDWNIGNFSVINKHELFSRWDYDWFRISYRMLDFYFLSRVVSDVGDRTVFSYVIDTMMEPRFLMFLTEYHKVFPLKADEIRFLREAYRFFILNYVVKDGNHFFSPEYAKKLRNEAFEIYLPSVDRDFDPEKIIKHLKITG
ncbi:hypothetical protein [Phnomibacter sp. MR]|uniref:hypothetical protein n=1 Tax=Phnomibacter sp. MR TaxID=3042318 RepID=UPI003A7FB7E4